MKYYCEYCGWEASTLQHLTKGTCRRSPNGYHIPYEGGEKSKYFCKYCGWESSTLQHLTKGPCKKSPTGYHVPAL